MTAMCSVSDDIKHLDNDSMKRYMSKLDIAGVTDPYTLPRALFSMPASLPASSLPNLTSVDIMYYLIESPSPYKRQVSE